MDKTQIMDLVTKVRINLYRTYLYVNNVKIMLTLFEKNIYIIDEVEETLTYMNTEGKIC